MPTFELTQKHQPLFLTPPELEKDLAKALERIESNPKDLPQVLGIFAFNVARAQLKKAGDLGCLASPVLNANDSSS